MNGFAVIMCVDVLCGIGDGFNTIDATGQADVRIHNGTVQGSKLTCIHVGNNTQLRDLNTRDCRRGLFAGNYAQITNVNVSDSTFQGIFMGPGSLLAQSTVTGSGSYGVQVSRNALVIDSVILSNQGAITTSSFQAIIRGGYRGNVITKNNDSTEDQLISGVLIDLGGNICGSDTVCP